MKRFAFLALASLALAVTGCGSSSSSNSTSSTASSPSSSATSSASTTSSSASGSKIHVSMKNLAYDPKTVGAKVGQTVQWTNDDIPPHNVTYVSGPKFASSSTMNPGATFQIKLTKPGTIKYLCTIHPFMKGTIVVKP